MHELVYVLTVEALIFGLLGVVLVAQRFNVFQWPLGETWPVFASCVMFVLAYAQVLLMLCCSIAVAGLGALSLGVMDACARSAGRLASTAVVSVIYVAGLLLIYKQTEPQTAGCYLNQLWGTSCSGAVLWSYGVYLAVLLPVWALVAGLQVTSASMCKDVKKAARKRLLCVNCAYLIVYNVNSTLHKNGACLLACTSVKTPRPLSESKLELDRDLLFFVMALFVGDVIVEGLMQHRTLLTAGFASVVRCLQLGAVPVFNQYSVKPLPWQLLAAHLSLGGLLCLLDVLEVLVPYVTAHDAAATAAATAAAAEETANKAREEEDAVLALETRGKRQAAAIGGKQNKPFEVDSGSRRKFMLTFTGKTRWPTMLNVPSVKKTT